MKILAMPLSDTFRKAIISIYKKMYLQTFVVLLEFLSVGSILFNPFANLYAIATVKRSDSNNGRVFFCE
jgi:hypothetical protein